MHPFHYPLAPLLAFTTIAQVLPKDSTCLVIPVTAVATCLLEELTIERGLVLPMQAGLTIVPNRRPSNSLSQKSYPVKVPTQVGEVVVELQVVMVSWKGQ